MERQNALKLFAVESEIPRLPLLMNVKAFQECDASPVYHSPSLPQMTDWVDFYYEMKIPIH